MLLWLVTERSSGLVERDVHLQRPPARHRLIPLNIPVQVKILITPKE